MVEGDHASSFRSPDGWMITSTRGDITRPSPGRTSLDAPLDAPLDAIVNAANASLKAGGGVDGAIHRAAGPGLQRELDGLGGCPTGEARISGAHDLATTLGIRHVIHCVGPVWPGVPDDERFLAACHRAALDLARRHGIRRIAFPAIGTGVYGYPTNEAARVAVGAVKAELEADSVTTAGPMVEVRFVLFDDESLAHFARALGDS